jgi:DNA modification methylase
MMDGVVLDDAHINNGQAQVQSPIVIFDTPDSTVPLEMCPSLDGRTLSYPAIPTFDVMENDWSFADLPRKETLWGPHGYHRYPAKFIPQLVRRIIEIYSTPGSFVGDPFLGSGTTGVEALRAGRRFWGSDINPVALLISQAKCTPIEPHILTEGWEQLHLRLDRIPHIGSRKLTEDEKAAIAAIDIARASGEERLAYWFPVAHRQSLSCLLEVINESTTGEIRTFFLCAFSNILRRCSIWLSGSTKPQKDLQKKLGDPTEEFRKQVRNMLRRNNLYWSDVTVVENRVAPAFQQCQLVLEDTRRLSLPDGALDLLVTSPPYATCYEYIELHQLTQLWLGAVGILPGIDLHHVCIGSKNVSNRLHETELLQSTGSKAADKALYQLVELGIGSIAQTVTQEVRALRHYFRDMQAAVCEFARITAPGKYLVIVIGDSCKRGVTIPTSTALVEIATALGFTLEWTIVRKVPVRVLVSKRDKKTGRFSSTAQSDTQVYPEESILVFTRRTDNSLIIG